MATTLSPRNKYDFPTPRSRNAPKTFSGRYDEVDLFLKEFEALATAYNLTNDEAFEYVTRYVKRPVREIIEGLQEYAAKDWPRFADTLRKLFNHDKLAKRFKEKDLLKFVAKNQKKSIRNMDKYKSYQKKFIRIGGWLLQRNKITKPEYCKYYWLGIPPSARKKLEERMLLVEPALSRATPYSVEKVDAAAAHIYDTSRFYDEDSDFDDSDSEKEEDSSTESLEDDGDDGSSDLDSDSDEEEIKKLRRVTHKQPKKSKKTKKSRKDTSHPQSSTPSQKDTDEVADLIDKLGRLKLNDPAYPALYFRIISKAPQTAAFLSKPTQRTPEFTPRTIPSTSSSPQSSNNGQIKCYFCGEGGHSLRSCNQANSMIDAGTIMRNDQGRITWPDGTSILRNGSENILTAVNRELAFRARVNRDRPVSTNLIYETYDLTYPDDASDDDFEDDEGGMVFAQEIFPVIRTKETQKEERKKKPTFDGIYPPPLQKSTEPDHNKGVPKKKDLDIPNLPRPTFYPGEVVIRSGDSDDDEIMEDVTMEDATEESLPKAKAKRKKVPAQREDKASKLPKPNLPNPETFPRPNPPATISLPKNQSQCQRDFNSQDLFQKICGTPISVTLQEILGSSPVLAKKMQDYLRVTRTPVATIPEKVNAIGHPTEYHPQDARLIAIRMTFDNNHSVNTLIDCGSELDIIGHKACMQAQLPVDTSLTTIMRDAGQHDTMMEGRCHDVNLKAGNLVTTTDIWVSGKVPFALLLGRPWQRRNRISIDERETGTWLCRRNPHGKIVWETCAVPARHAEEFLEPFHGHFFGQGSHEHSDIYVAQMSLNSNKNSEDEPTKKKKI